MSDWRKINPEGVWLRTAGAMHGRVSINWEGGAGYVAYTYPADEPFGGNQKRVGKFDTAQAARDACDKQLKASQ